jgi:hypothetical protein
MRNCYDPYRIGSMGDPVQDGFVASLARRKYYWYDFFRSGTALQEFCFFEGIAPSNVSRGWPLAAGRIWRTD